MRLFLFVYVHQFSRHSTITELIRFRTPDEAPWNYNMFISKLTSVCGCMEECIYAEGSRKWRFRILHIFLVKIHFPKELFFITQILTICGVQGTYIDSMNKYTLFNIRVVLILRVYMFRTSTDGLICAYTLSVG